MKKFLTLCLLILGSLAFTVYGQVPGFATYSVRVEAVKAKDINFRNNSEARRYRTTLRESLRDGVDFSGHFIISQWGCGAACLDGAIVDARTGNVYWPKQLRGVYAGEDQPVVYRKDSRLLIFNGYPASETEKPMGKYFYEWTGTRLKFIKFVKED